jgi:hypothetical protein
MSSDLKVVKIGKAKPDYDVIKEAKDILEGSESGKVRGFACVLQLDDGMTASIVTGSELNRMWMLGAASRLTHKINRMLEDSTEPMDSLPKMEHDEDGDEAS